MQLGGRAKKGVASEDDDSVVGIGHRLHILSNTILRSAKRGYPVLAGVRPVEAWVIRHIGNHDRVTARAIAGAISADEGQVSRAIASLTRSGMIRRSDDPCDSRRKVVVLTPAGRKAFNVIQQAYVDRQRQLLCGLNERDVRRLLDYLDLIENNAHTMLELPLNGTKPKRR